MKVQIKRSIKGTKIGEIDVEKIGGLKWDNISSGYNEKHFGYSLYGYISYKLAMELVDCSGLHAEYDNYVKIMIPNNLNKKEEFKEGYDYLACKAGHKPHCRIDGQKPCSKTIMRILKDKKEIKRVELRKILIDENYSPNLIIHAIKRLEKANKIKLSPRERYHWRTQVISLL